MTLEESIIAILAVSITIWMGGWVVRTLWRIGGRNEAQILADEIAEVEKIKKDLFD